MDAESIFIQRHQSYPLLCWHWLESCDIFLWELITYIEEGINWGSKSSEVFDLGPSVQVDEVTDQQKVSQHRTIVVSYHHMGKQLYSLQYQNVKIYKNISQIIFFILL